MPWLAKASEPQRCYALKVGLILHQLAGMRKTYNDLVLTVERCEVLGLRRKSVQRGLKDLERLGLIRVKRETGKAPRVDILHEW